MGSILTMKKKKSKIIVVSCQGGFTFIELLLYLAIVTIMMTALIPFAWNIIEAGVKNSTEQEVFSNARYISEQLKYQIRNASGINSVAATQISLATSISNTNPTIIGLSGSNLTMKQGAASPINLNSQNASISALTFTNYTSGDNKTKNIQFTFTVSASYSASKRQEYNDSTAIESSAEVRSN
jgi:type II secretory pathway pseudopilin PulG